MKLRRSYLLILAVFILVVCIIFALSRLNRYQTDGILNLAGLKARVTVVRDEKGMPYIYAADNEDAFLALGFITAQDRLFNMELIRLWAEGRLSELAGAKTESLDVSMRTIGFLRNARKLAATLDTQSRTYLQKYVDGINAYIRDRHNEHPLEFRLSGLKPGYWRIEDSLAILFFMSWTTSGNLDTEIVVQALIDKLGVRAAGNLFPLNINPDDPSKRTAPSKRVSSGFILPEFESDRSLPALLDDRLLRFGSNNWATGPEFSERGKPILANDPHLDARILPGPWYPFGLITPEFRWVGVALPGIPGSIVGRNQDVAMGITNSYGDTQDLYIETLDPASSGRYLEGKRSYPFQVLSEKIRIRDKAAPKGFRDRTIEVRLTHRGPVVSGVFSGVDTKKVVTLRWAPFETVTPNLPLAAIMKVKSARQLREVLSGFDFMALNFVFADVDGNIGWQTTGKLPIRAQRDGTLPYRVTDGKDNWIGWIPFEWMPQKDNPKEGWVGTCNQYTVPHDYPYYYSSFAAPSYRYRRLTELMGTPQKKTVDDHWRFQRDTLNVMARTVAPIMGKALIGYEDTKNMGSILLKWNFEDNADQAAPTIFQAVYREFAVLVFQDRLGEAAPLMLKSWYFWQERLQACLLEDALPFSPSENKDPEKINDLFHRAAQKAFAALSPELGEDVSGWLWGKVHKMELLNPIRREGFGKALLGATYSMSGSGETLNRASYDFRNPFEVNYSASLRMVADLGDPDKVLAVLPGGVCGRTFHPHHKDQLEAFIKGEKRYWWFSDRAIQEHKKTQLSLTP